MPEDILDNKALCSPFIASIEGKDPEAKQKFFEQFSQQPQNVREFITSLDTVSAIKQLVDSGTLPPQYAVAIAKIVALAAMGEIPMGGIGELLMKLDLPAQQSEDVAGKINQLLEPVIADRARIAVPSMPELPPLTQKIPPPVIPRPDSSKPPGRNIIDLRKQQPEV